MGDLGVWGVSKPSEQSNAFERSLITKAEGGVQVMIAARAR